MKTCPTCGKRYEGSNTLCPDDGAVLKAEGGDRLVGELLAGKYRVEERLAEGGMGCVYRATHVLMEKTVAVKILHPALSADERVVARFTREAKAASRISHPHALTVTDFGESEGGVVFLVMEYLDGRTLKEVVRSEGPMPLGRVVEIVRQVAGALQAAHDQGVVHRDLKSDNIMLVESGGGDWAKVLDFGIAKIMDSVGSKDPALTAPNLIIGTPQYMSPEQCSQDSEIGPPSDVYSLGVIIFEMLAGRVPFMGDSPTAVMLKQVREPPPSLAGERPDLPAEVGAVVARALAKDPGERFRSAAQLSEAFVRAAGAKSTATVAGAAAAPDTLRINVPTAQNEPAQQTADDEAEEATIISGEVAPPAGEGALPPPAPPAGAGSNIGRVVLYSLAALALIAAAVFALQRGISGDGEARQPLPQLTPAPDSLPAQAIRPPTGQAEADLAPAGTPTPPAAGADIPVQTLPDPGSFAVTEPTPLTVIPDANTNSNAEANTNSDQRGQSEAATKPSPVTSPRQQRTPAADPDDLPPPAPSPGRQRQPQPKPTPAPPTRIEGDTAGGNRPR